MADKVDRQMFERYKDVQTVSAFPTFRNPWTPPEVQRALLERLQHAFPRMPGSA